MHKPLHYVSLMFVQLPSSAPEYGSYFKLDALRLSDSVRQAAERDGVSLNQFINLAVAEKTAALVGADIVANRAARADRAAFDAVMSRVGREPPQDGDEL